MNVKKVYVLLSAYNGEKYIKEQINSILAQEGVQIELFIRDDGSKDGTIDIVKRFKEKDSRVHLVEGENIGAKYSFLTLLQSVDTGADYYAFSDQDDYWLEDKLCKAIEKIETECVKGRPVLYYSYTRLVDETLHELNTVNSFNKKNAYNFGQILIKNCASGCTMVLSRQLKEMVSKRNVMDLLPYPLHDHWLYMVCLAVGGKVVFDKNSYILYRQHSGNVIGGQRKLIEKIRNSPLIRGGNERFNWSCQLLKQYGGDMPEDNRNLLLMIVDYKRNIGTRLKLAANACVKPPELIEKIVVVMTVLRKGF